MQFLSWDFCVEDLRIDALCGALCQAGYRDQSLMDGFFDYRRADIRVIVVPRTGRVQIRLSSSVALADRVQLAHDTAHKLERLMAAPHHEHSG